jgi:hypothetical protein
MWGFAMAVVRYRRLSFLGFPIYRVGTDGSVWTLRMNRKHRYRWKQLSGAYNSKLKRKRYLRHKLSDWTTGNIQTFLTHRLVLLAFVGPCPDGHEACHNNNKRCDNRLKNLRWDTPSNNQKDRVKHGTSVRGISNNVGSKNGGAILSEAKVKRIRSKYKTGKYTQKQLALIYRVSHWTIMGIVNMTKWAHVQ